MTPTATHTPLRSPAAPEVKKEGSLAGKDVEKAWPDNASCGRADQGRTGWRRCARWTLDVVLYVSVLAVVLMMVVGIIPQRSAVISCNDPSIRREIRKETIPISYLFVGSFIVPFFFMLIVEWLVPPNTSPPNRSTSPLRRGLQQSWSFLGDLFVGGLFMYFVTDLLKITVGEARPIFWETCKPNLTKEQCDAQEYITVSISDCTNPKNLTGWRVKESMKSFPSGHASISVFATIFMMAYIHKRLWQRCSSLLSPWLQLLWVLWAVMCCQSRVWDNKHFWWDVACGALLGGVCSFLTVHYMSNWFERLEDTKHNSIAKEEEEEEEEGDNTSRFSRNSMKRLIAGGGGGGGGGGGRGGGGEGGGEGERELRNFNSAP